MDNSQYPKASKPRPSWEIPINFRPETLEWLRNMLLENAYETHTIVFKLEYYPDAALVTALGANKKLGEFTITRRLSTEEGEAVLKKMRSMIRQEEAAWKVKQERKEEKENE